MVRGKRKLPIETAEVILQRTEELHHLREVTGAANRSIGMAKYQAEATKKALSKIQKEYSGSVPTKEPTGVEYSFENIDVEDLFNFEDAS